MMLNFDPDKPLAGEMRIVVSVVRVFGTNGGLN